MTTQRRVGTRKLGWCLDGYHTACVHITPHLALVCACDCHDTPNTNPPTNDPVLC